MAGGRHGPGGVGRAVEVLRGGGLVAFPTETVYGLGADAANPEAVRRLYAVKGRPASHPVIVHLADPARLDELARDVPSVARRLAAACWPGPLTLVLAKRDGPVCAEATGGRPTVGLRVPDQPLALELLRAFGSGVAAPSANRFGRVSPTTAAHVRNDLDRDVDLVLDGGRCRIGVESTIVDCSGPELAVLRVGGVGIERVAEVAGEQPALRTDGSTPAPGTLAAHYAPRARVEVLATVQDAVSRARVLTAQGEHAVALVPDPAPAGVEVVASPRDAEEYAAVLYAALREADARGADAVLAVPPEPRAGGLAPAIADRLARAARGTRR